MRSFSSSCFLACLLICFCFPASSCLLPFFCHIIQPYFHTLYHLSYYTACLLYSMSPFILLHPSFTLSFLFWFHFFFHTISNLTHFLPFSILSNLFRSFLSLFILAFHRLYSTNSSFSSLSTKRRFWKDRAAALSTRIRWTREFWVLKIYRLFFFFL